MLQIFTKVDKSCKLTELANNENKDLTKLMTTQSSDEYIETSVIELVEKLAKTKINLETAKCPLGYSSSK